jgi:hypothetical protein
VQPEPALGDYEIQTGFVFRGRALELMQKGRIDLLDVDSAVLNRLDSFGEQLIDRRLV